MVYDLLRVTLLFAFVCVFFVNQGFAGRFKEKEEVAQRRNPPRLVRQDKKKKLSEWKPQPKISKKKKNSQARKNKTSARNIESKTPKKTLKKKSAPALKNSSTLQKTATDKKNKPLKRKPESKNSKEEMAREIKKHKKLTHNIEPRTPKKKPTHTLQPSPVTEEKEVFREARNVLATLPTPVFSPIARPLLLSTINNSYFNKMKIEDMVVYWPNGIIRWENLVLTKNKKNKYHWETNLQRALGGRAPVAYKGISAYVDPKKLSSTAAKGILKLQRTYTMQVHHLTQKGVGTEDDPYVIVTQTCHMGTNSRYIVEEDENGKNRVVHSGLSTEEAEALCLPHQTILTNLLHFRRGKSLVSRGTFNEHRQEIWKTLAELSSEDSSIAPIVLDLEAP